MSIIIAWLAPYQWKLNPWILCWNPINIENWALHDSVLFSAIWITLYSWPFWNIPTITPIGWSIMKLIKVVNKMITWDGELKSAIAKNIYVSIKYCKFTIQTLLKAWRKMSKNILKCFKISLWDSIAPQFWYTCPFYILQASRAQPMGENGVW